MQLYGTRSLEDGSFLRADYGVRLLHRACTVQRRPLTSLAAVMQIRTRDTAFNRVIDYQRYASGALYIPALRKQW